jgi:uncharacterized BrkB/YihY/UPF0761 family membrane protein
MTTMRRLNDLSTAGLAVFALTALLPLLVVAVPVMLGGQVPPPERDEGTGAHIFQLSIAALLPVGLLFLATADWSQSAQIARRLAFPIAAVLLAFTTLYYFEHPR